MDDYEAAHDLLNALIAVYSGRIHAAPGEEAVSLLRQERAPFLAERDSLTPNSRERITEILDLLPERIRSVRAGGADE
ncbi:hypothetical protein SZN_02357 [Streptomyces zinciresistens K42]|uniref:Uncharacterized protein n=1 Tax=Streptomyces zinciresistens K42 TaxID=700597 RepID=G2G4R8_9ACTN|nr:hypothetical protein [Streptomyces zinciresistens]EGX61541.1 hypothetical protein SZN_02357 [Streptomyces zinciresistens K42]